MNTTQPGVTSAPAHHKKPMSTAKIVLITVAATVVACTIPLILIALLIVKSNSTAGDGAKNLPHDTQAQAISSSEYAAAENFIAKPLSYTSDYWISYKDYQALPDDMRELRTISLDSKNSANLTDEVAKGICTQEGQTVTCYAKLSEVTALRKKMVYAANSASITALKSTSMSDSMLINRDAVTGHDYGSNFAGDYTWKDLYAIDYDSATATARALTPGPEFPTRTDAFTKHNTNFFVEMHYFDLGIDSVIKFDFQVVNGQFYGVYGSPRDQSAVLSVDKGIFHYDAPTQKWVHLTPGIDYETSADSSLTAAYKIAKDGCTVLYKVAGKYYSLNACKA